MRWIFPPQAATDIAKLNLPRSLSYAGNLALVSKLSEADTADAVLAEVSVGSAADLATVVLSCGELLLLLLLVDHSLLCHFLIPPVIISQRERP